MALDPVCGMEVDPESAAASSRVGAQVFYFCSDSCKRQFDASQSPSGPSNRPLNSRPLELLEMAPVRRQACRQAPVAAETATATLNISGMHCASCVGRVEKALSGVPGVVRAAVDLTTRSASVAYDPSAASPEDLAAAVRDAGYEASLVTADSPPEQDDRADAAFRIRLIGAVLLTLPVFVLEMFFMGWAPGRWLSLVLSAPVVFWAGWEFHRGAIASVRRRSADMNTLISVGTLTAFLYSAGVLLLSPAGHAVHTYFETAAVITTVILLGRALEARARGRASQAVRALMDLQPQTACLIRDGGEVRIPVERVFPGDILLVRPGERIPVDGVIVSGSSAIDESL
ncbi:MAG: cation transporter, partial [Armatimonadota bacterium]